MDATTKAKLALCLLGSLVAASTQAQPTPPYRIDKAGRAHVTSRQRDGRPTILVTIQFKVVQPDGQPAWDVGAKEIVVEEDDQRITDLEVRLPTAAGAFTGVLALDVSGSMAARDKLAQARQAALTFLDRLDERADCGLLLFDHRLLKREAPSGNRQPHPERRQQLRQLIEEAVPRGGTAYLDATAEAIAMLRDATGRRAVVVLTDGVDLNSQRTLDEVIAQAQAAAVPVYTVGVGEPGRREPVATVLVLDCSGSMKELAGGGDGRSKMAALQEAAARFVDLMRPEARTSLLPFSDRFAIPEPFTRDQAALKRRLRTLEAAGGARLYDAIYAALECLAKEPALGNKAVLALADGRDGAPGSERTIGAVIELARQAGIPVHALEFGAAGVVNATVLQTIALRTGGSYHHAHTSQALHEIFERLSIGLHGDGIEEASLRQLAEATGGKYYPVREAAQLCQIYGEAAEELQTSYTVTFPSRRQSYDGTSRGIAISVVRHGQRLSDVARMDYTVHGLVVPELDRPVYLWSLATLGVLLALPTALRRLGRSRLGA